MKPGLSADCVITLKEVRDTVHVPTLAIFEKDSSRGVYVKKNKSFIPVRVETGSSGSSQTIITSGLKGNEVIALSEPPGSLIKKELKSPVKPDTIKNHINP
jgi:macrolide-specific efflux system membrane fusion protein